MDQKAAVKEIVDQLEQGTASVQVFPDQHVPNTSGLRFRPTSKANVETHQRFIEAAKQLIVELKPFHACSPDGHCEPNCNKMMYWFDVSHEPGLTNAKVIEKHHAKLHEHHVKRTEIDQVLDVATEQRLTSLGVSIVRPGTPELPDFTNSWFQGTTTKGTLLFDTLQAKQSLEVRF